MAVVKVAELSPRGTWMMTAMLSLATVIILSIIIYLVVLKMVLFLLRGDGEEEEDEKEAEEKSDVSCAENVRIQDQHYYKSSQNGGTGASDSPIRKYVGLTQSTTVEISREKLINFHDRSDIGRYVFRVIIAVACFLLCFVYLYGTEFGSSGPKNYSVPDSSKNGASFKNYNTLDRANENHQKEAKEVPPSADFHGNQNIGKVLTIKFKDNFNFFHSVNKEQYEKFNDEKKYLNHFALSVKEDILEQKETSSEDNIKDEQIHIYAPPVDNFPPNSAEKQQLKAVPIPVENNSRENIEHDPFSISFDQNVVTIAFVLSIVLLVLIITNLMLICYIWKNNEQK